MVSNLTRSFLVEVLQNRKQTALHDATDMIVKRFGPST
jgi:hypothetical protein